MPVTRTSLPGAAVVAASNRCRARRCACAPCCSTARSTAGRHEAVATVGSAQRAREGQRGVDGHEQADRHREAQDPAGGGEQRHVHVVEHEHLVAQDREPVEIVGPLVVLDGGDVRLQPRDVRFQGDGDPVAEAALGTVADDAQHPRQGGRGGEAARGDGDEGGVAADQPVGEELQPHRHQRVGEGGQERERERDGQQRRLGVEAAPERAPHRRQRRRHVVGGVRRLSRGHRGPPLALPRIAAEARATSTAAPPACRRRGAPAQSRASRPASSSSAKRCACRSNMVR